MSEFILELQNLTKIYQSLLCVTAKKLKLNSWAENLNKKSIKAVDSINLQVKKGEIFGFLGPNGAGKSTTIKMIAGLSSITEGEIFISGKSVKNNRIDAISNLGGIIEGPDMYQNLTGYENLKYFAKIQGGISDNRINEILELVSLKDRANTKVATYSLGMKQRLGIAQAIMHNPKLLLLDEPMNGLDPSGIQGMRNLLKKLASMGVTVFTSSHILSEMQQLCDRVGIIDRGRITAIEDMNSICNEKSDVVHYVVDNMELAKSVITNYNNAIEVATENNILVVYIGENEVPLVTKELILNGVMVSSVDIKKKTLEQMFMEKTTAKEGAFDEK